MDEAELLAAIVAAPDDDAPRLVLADLLQQRGDPRGELIALQCAAAPSPENEARALVLLDAHRDRWAGELGLGGAQVTFRRGFPERVHVTVKQLAELAARNPRPAPIRAVRVTPVASGADTGLALEGCVRLGAAHLDLSGNPIGSLGVSRLVHAPELRRLTTLSLAGCALIPRVLLNLLGSVNLGELVALDLKRNDLRGVGPSFSSLKALPRLERLDASVSDLGDPGTIALAGSPLRPRWLRLRRNRIGPLGFSALLASPFASELRHLDVAGNAIGRIADGMLAAPHGRALATLDLTGCSVPVDEVIRLLRARPALTVLAREKARDALAPEFGDRVRVSPLPPTAITAD